MHYGSKGWYVQELKKLGMTKYEGRKLQSYKTHFLANLLDSVKNNLHISSRAALLTRLFLCAQLFFKRRSPAV